MKKPMQGQCGDKAASARECAKMSKDMVMNRNAMRKMGADKMSGGTISRGKNA